MYTGKAMIAAVVVSLALAGGAYALISDHPDPVEFYKGHTHSHDGVTIGAPQHSGGTNAAGCHNASVPYHCH